ncbi:MAG: hypothetical protein ACXVEE_44100, partial [Polyangiales bacterium]
MTKGVLRTYRAGAVTVGFDLDGPTADLVALEKELLAFEERIAREGGKVHALFCRIKGVVAILGGPSFVRFARSYIERTPTFQRAAVYVERSFVVRTVVDPIALLAPRISIKTFSNIDQATGWTKDI